MRPALLVPVLLMPAVSPLQAELPAPEDTLRAFLKAMQGFDFDRAGALVKGFDPAFPAWVEVRNGMDTAEARKAGAPELQGLSLGPCQVQRKGDRAEVEVVLLDAQSRLFPGGRVQERVVLELHQGRWLLVPGEWTWKDPQPGFFGRVVPVMVPEGATRFLQDQKGGQRAGAAHEVGRFLLQTFQEAVQKVWEAPDPGWGEGKARTQALANAVLRRALAAPGVGTLKNPYQPDGKPWVLGTAKVSAEHAGTVFIDLATVHRKEDPAITLTIVYLDRDGKPASTPMRVPVE